MGEVFYIDETDQCKSNFHLRFLSTKEQLRVMEAGKAVRLEARWQTRA